MEYQIGKIIEDVIYKIDKCIGYDYDEIPEGTTTEEMIKCLKDIRSVLKRELD